MAIRSKYLSESDVQRLINETEREVQELAEQQELQRWIDNPANAQQLAAIRAEFAAIDARRAKTAQTTQQPQRSTFSPGSPQSPIPPQLKYDRPSVSKIIDPMAR